MRQVIRGFDSSWRYGEAKIENTPRNVFDEFNVPENERQDVEILLAVYECPPYEGSAFVLFKKYGKLYEVNGSHCSCYGLENQWSPEETSIEALKIRNMNVYYGEEFQKLFVDYILELERQPN